MPESLNKRCEVTSFLFKAVIGTRSRGMELTWCLCNHINLEDCNRTRFTHFEACTIFAGESLKYRFFHGKDQGNEAYSSSLGCRRYWLGVGGEYQPAIPLIAKRGGEYRWFVAI